jgi:tetratricopeptide (TPR) repeat protein
MAITAYMSAGNASRAANEPNWNRHFGAVRDVVAHIENKGPLYWEMIPLANYYHSLDQQDKALPLYRNAAKNLQNDFLVNHYLALTVELDEQPDAEIMARFQRGELKTFGLGGFGCLQATKGNVHQAVETAYQIVDQYPRSAESLAEAAFVLRLAGRSDEAERLVRERIESVSETSSSPALQWVRDSLLPYYAENWDDQKLIDRSERSSCSGSCLSGAYCTIGVKQLALNRIEEAKKNFRKCVEQRIYFLHAHAWSCALLKWIERRNGGFRDGAGPGA